MTKPMNKIEKLIAELCPEGIEFKELGELGVFYGGLSGKSKNDFNNGNSKYITYMNVFSNISVDIKINDFVKVNKEEKQNKVNFGDVLFTGSSETPDECGMSSVLTENIEEALYLNSFCFGFRLHDINLFSPEFLKYLFREEQIRKQITKTTSGVTRFNISKKRFDKIKIPIPPLAIQQEIVKILDTFTTLEAELEAELNARRKQIEKIIAGILIKPNNQLRKIDDITEVKSGGTPDTKIVKYWKNGNVPWLKSESCKENYIAEPNGFITELGLKNSSAKWLEPNTTLMALVGATKAKTAFLTFKATTNQNIAGIKSLDENIALDKFIFYILRGMYKKIIKGKTAYHMLNLSDIKNIEIPIPPLAIQQEIVKILDTFTTLEAELEAELNARRKQYEYYRNKLLTFKPLEKEYANQ